MSQTHLPRCVTCGRREYAILFGTHVCSGKPPKLPKSKPPKPRKPRTYKNQDFHEEVCATFVVVHDREMTFAEIGEVFGVCAERIRQIEAKALRKLRHPSLSRYLRSLIEEDSELWRPSPGCRRIVPQIFFDRSDERVEEDDSH